MHRLTILYGEPTDPVAFRRYYEDVHIPLASKMKGLSGWKLSWIDPSPDGEKSSFILIAELYAESPDAMAAILASPEGLAANRDLDNFVTGSVEFLAGEEIDVVLS